MYVFIALDIGRNTRGRKKRNTLDCLLLSLPNNFMNHKTCLIQRHEFHQQPIRMPKPPSPNSKQMASHPHVGQSDQQARSHSTVKPHFPSCVPNFSAFLTAKCRQNVEAPPKKREMRLLFACRIPWPIRVWGALRGTAGRTLNPNPTGDEMRRYGSY
jgi:hypothetical protein